MKQFTAVVDGETVEISFERTGSRIVATIAGRKYSVEATNVAKGVYWFNWNDQSIEVTILPAGDLYSVTIGNNRIPVEILDSHKKFQRSAHKGPSGAAEIRAPMPGRIVRVLTSPGQDVHANQGIVVMEAMKMQNEIKSPTNGKIRSLDVAEGETVLSGHLIAVIE